MIAQFGTYKDWTLCLINLLSLSLGVLANTDGESSTTTIPSTTPETTMASSFSRRLIIRRNHRMMSIVQNVMDSFGWLTVPTVDSGARNRYLNSMNRSIIEDMTVVQGMCYPAKCYVPTYIDSAAWNAPDSMSMNFFFDVLQSTDQPTRVKNATLYLFVKSRSDCECEGSYSNNDVRLIVAIYQYYPYGVMLLRTRGPNGQRITREVTVNSSSRKRLLSMKLLQWQRREDVIDFDVTEAVHFWITRRQRNQEPNARRGRHRQRQRRNQRRFRANFGLEVTVDELFINRRERDQYNASSVFTDAECNLPFDVPCMEAEVARRLRPTPVLNVWTERRPPLPRSKRDADESYSTSAPPATKSTLDKTLGGKKEKGEDSAGKT